MKHKRLRLLTIALILGCAMLAGAASVGKVLVGGDGTVFRGASWDVRTISNHVTINEAGVATITQNAVTNTELDNTDDYIMNSLTVTGDLSVQGDFGPFAEMHGQEITISIDAGPWANVIGLSAELVSATGMFQNATDGSVTVSNGGFYKFIGSTSVEDNDGPSEEYHFVVGVGGVPTGKCEEHRSISVQASLASISMSCALDLSANDVVTFLVNSVGGDKPTFEHINWMIFK